MSCSPSLSPGRAQMGVSISRHTVVCHVAQENRARAHYVSILTGTIKSRFSRIYNLVVFYLINPKVAVEPTKRDYTPNLKKIARSVSEIWVSKLSSFFLRFFFFSSSSSSFCTLKTIAVTHKLVLQSSWNWVHLLGIKRR